jgi:hypothetical protein
MSPACSQVALRTVHQRPKRNTGTSPLAPNTNSAVLLGARIESGPAILPIAVPDLASVRT